MYVDFIFQGSSQQQYQSIPTQPVAPEPASGQAVNLVQNNKSNPDGMENIRLVEPEDLPPDEVA